MRKRTETVTAIVKVLGGAEAVATLFGVVPNAVYNWTARNKLPPRTYFVIRDALAKKGLTAPDHLWTMAEPKAPPSEPSRAGAAA